MALRGDVAVLADAFEALAHDLFALAIHARRVEIADAAVVGVAHHGHALVQREQGDAVGRDKDLHHGRTAHAQHGQLVPGLAEGPQRNARRSDLDARLAAGVAATAALAPSRLPPAAAKRAGLEKLDAVRTSCKASDMAGSPELLSDVFRQPPLSLFAFGATTWPR